MGREDLRVKHEKQRHSWDCGLACTRMILKTYGRDVSKFQDTCDSLGIDISVWTVDIAAILTSYTINYLFITKHAGVDERYENEPFYERNIKKDMKRIQQLFKNADSLNINIQQRCVKESEITEHLESHQPIIILLDWNKIKPKTRMFSCIDCSQNHKYQGHYIVLVSYDKDKDCYYYLDPQKDSRQRNMGSDALKRASRTFGTDEDIIFIYLD